MLGCRVRLCRGRSVCWLRLWARWGEKFSPRRSSGRDEVALLSRYARCTWRVKYCKTQREYLQAKGQPVGGILLPAWVAGSVRSAGTELWRLAGGMAMAMGLSQRPEPHPGPRRDEEPRHLGAGGDRFLTESTSSGKEFCISILLGEKLSLRCFYARVMFGDYFLSLIILKQCYAACVRAAFPRSVLWQTLSFASTCLRGKGAKIFCFSGCAQTLVLATDGLGHQAKSHRLSAGSSRVTIAPLAPPPPALPSPRKASGNTDPQISLLCMN